MNIKKRITIPSTDPDGPLMFEALQLKQENSNNAPERLVTLTLNPLEIPTTVYT